MKRILLFVLSFVVPGYMANAADQVGVGEMAPEFELSDQNGQLHSLEDYRDQWVVLYFYPKDETPAPLFHFASREKYLEFLKLFQAFVIFHEGLERHR